MPWFGSSATAVISRATMKEAIRQPVFLLLMSLGVAVCLLYFFIPFFTLGDDYKVFKDCCLATLLIFGLIQAVWTSSTSIAEEIEGKTAMTLLSKPVNRREFILGKYFGILGSVVLLFLPIILTFLICLYFKVPYDGKESGNSDVKASESIAQIIQVLPGIALIFMEVAVMTSVSVAISTRLPMVVNMVTCLAIFVVGHLTPLLVSAGALQFELVEFMARLIAMILPALETFNIAPAIATGNEVPPVYLGSSLLYSVCYITAAILMSFILFEDRDLA